MVARSVRDAEVGGSSPPTPTILDIMLWMAGHIENNTVSPLLMLTNIHDRVYLLTLYISFLGVFKML